MSFILTVLLLFGRIFGGINVLHVRDSTVYGQGWRVQSSKHSSHRPKLLRIVGKYEESVKCAIPNGTTGEQTSAFICEGKLLENKIKQKIYIFVSMGQRGRL